MNVFAADFGPLVVAEDVNASVISALTYWLPTHIHHVELDRGITAGTIARPKPESYATVRMEQDWHDHRLPAVIVETAGTLLVDKVSGGSGIYSAEWRLQVTCVLRGRNYPETQRYASLFEGAVRRTLLQQPNQLLGRVWWLGTDPIRPVVDVTDQGRYMVAAVSHFKMATDNVAQSGAGPRVPSDPYTTPPVGAPDQVYGPLLPVARPVILEVDVDPQIGV